LLRREFLKYQGWMRRLPDQGVSLLVTLGGCTPEALGLCTLQALERMQADFNEAIFVVGGSTPKYDALRREADLLKGKITLQSNASNMADLMANADIAISAAGSTCWELCFLGVPSLLVDVAANQTPIAVEFQRQGCAIYLGSSREVTSEKLVDQLSALIKSRETLQVLSERCRKLVDGHGADRVITAMLGGESESRLSLLPEQELQL
jgi:UDP-2,4-diacetamido-2,4,6-trideoxy-beta-L-altropyranose hydrolase